MLAVRQNAKRVRIPEPLEAEEFRRVAGRASVDGASHHNLRGADLWQKAQPLLSTPVKGTRWVRWGDPEVRGFRAGLTALSQYSMLADDRLPTYAMRDKDLTRYLESGEIHGCAGRDEADARMRIWKYDPALLTETTTVDRCSLYLSLRSSADERVQKEIQNLVTLT